MSKPNSRRLRQKEAPDISVSSLTDRDVAIRAHFSSPEVQYVGSTSGCGCDFPHAIIQNGEWPFFEDPRVKDPVQEASDRVNREALISLLCATGEETIELYGVWDGDFAKPPKARETIFVNRVLDSEFRFKEQGFYTINLKGNLST